MTEHFITLSTTEPNNNIGIVKLRHADVNSQAIVAQIVENGQPKSFEGLQPFFCLMAQETTGQGLSEESVVSFDAKNGTLNYIASDNALQMVGRNEAYFSFRKQEGSQWIEQFSTRTFHYIVEKSIYSQPFKDSNYWWTFKELYRIFNKYIEDGKNSWEQFVEANREILESIDPGGIVLSELIRSRKPEGYSSAYPDLPARLDQQIGLNSDFRSFESGVSFLSRVKNEFLERGGNPKWYGAKFDGVTDDTQALQTCINNHQRIVLPPGTTIISDTLELTDKVMEGSQRQGTIIKMISLDKNKPAIKLGRHSSLSSMQIMFPLDNLPSLINTGEFVGVQLNLNTDTTLHRGIIKDVIIDGCGTGIYAPNSVFSCTFSDITIFNAKYIYMHFSGGTRTGNVYSNIYMSEQGMNKFKSKAGIWFEGEESDGTMSQINIEHMQVERAAYFENCRAMDVSTLHVEGVHIIKTDGSLFEFENSNMDFGGLTVYYTRGYKSGQSIFKLGSSYPKENLSSKTAMIHVNNLYFKGLNLPNVDIYNPTDYPYEERGLLGVGVQPFYFATRDVRAAANTDYVLKIENYDWFTWNNPKDDNRIYHEFKTLGNIVVDFCLVNRYEKIGKEIIINQPIHYQDVLADFIGVIGDTDISESGDIFHPKTWNNVINTSIQINGVNRIFEYSVYKISAENQTIRDYLNLVSGTYTQHVKVVELSSSSSLSVSGNFIQLDLPEKPKESINDQYTRCTHFPSFHYHTKYTAAFFSLAYLYDSGVLLSTDDNSTKISKFKIWLDQQKSNNRPVRIAYTKDTETRVNFKKETFFVNDDIVLKSNGDYSCKGVYHV